MNITINGLKLGEDTKFLMASPVAGLGKSPIRTSQGEYSGRDGGYVSAQVYSKRAITITGWIYGSDCNDNETLRSLLMEALEIRKLLPVYIRTFAGSYFMTMAYVIDLQMDVTNAKISEYKIDLVAPDPYLYDVGDGSDPDSGWVEQIVSKVFGGGYIFPYVMPVIWTQSSTPSIVTNLGDVTVYPQIVLMGKYTNPRITNLTTGQFIELNITTTEGDLLIIDMQNRTIVLNGGSVISTRTIDSSWWGVPVGSSTIEYISTSSTDAEDVVIRWRSRYTGI